MKPILTLFAGLLIFFSCVLYADEEKTIHVGRSSPEFMVRLPANPTTGFAWTVTQLDTSRLQLKSERYIMPVTQLMGTGGVSCFTFQWLGGRPEQKDTTIIFTYARSWDPSGARTTKIIVKVD